MEESHRRPRLKTPQRLNTAALFQIQQLDQDDRINVQEAAVAWTNSTSSGTATTATRSSTAMYGTHSGTGSTCRTSTRSGNVALAYRENALMWWLYTSSTQRVQSQFVVSQFLLNNTLLSHLIYRSRKFSDAHQTEFYCVTTTNVSTCMLHVVSRQWLIIKSSATFSEFYFDI